MKLENILTVSVLSLSLGAFSCKKFVQIGPPPDAVDTKTAFVDSSAASSAILGLYNNTNFAATKGAVQSNYVGGITVLAGACADDLYYFAGTSLQQYQNDAVPSSDGTNNVLWSVAYAEIYDINSAIEGLNETNALTATAKAQFLGEAYFLRAYNYFYLTNLYGDVPLVLSTTTSQNLTLPRTAQATVYDSIVSDLKLAQSLLPAAYPSAMEARANLYTATALLARVYLYAKDYPDAETQSTAVINSGLYSLAPVTNVFQNSSTETIWQLATFNGYSEFGLAFIPTTGATTPNYVIYPQLAASFEPGDQRFTDWLQPMTVGATTYYYPYKYQLSFATAGDEYSIMMRLAEQYLIRAEARAQQNNLAATGGAAADLNIVRARAGLGNTTAASQSDMLMAIENERWHELFSEMGHRWFDLNRTGRSPAVLGAEKPGFSANAELFPIPLIQIKANTNLTQNPGYN